MKSTEVMKKERFTRMMLNVYSQKYIRRPLMSLLILSSKPKYLLFATLLDVVFNLSSVL